MTVISWNEFRYGSSRSGSASTKSDDTKPVVITATEVETIVQKALTSAMSDLKELFNTKLQEISETVKAAEYRISKVEDRLSKLEHEHTTTKTSDELEVIRSESRESLLISNDNEQYSRNNNLRIWGLKPDNGESCCSAVLGFIKNVLHIVSITESDIEVAHIWPLYPHSWQVVNDDVNLLVYNHFTAEEIDYICTNEGYV